jgi:hypothetical protein
MTKNALFVSMLVICFLSSSALAANYYLSPLGNDSFSGTSPGQAWSTLQHVRAVGIAAGDTVFIMGGTYAGYQYFHDGSGTIFGTRNNPIVFKAYGDSQAVFTLTGHPTDPRYFLFYHRNNDYIIIDGYGHLPPYNQYSLKLEGHEHSGALIQFGSSSLGDPVNYIEGIVIKGVEIDGAHHDLVDCAIMLRHIRKSVIEDNYIHHIHKPTGNILPGDNTERIQSTGYGIYLQSCELTLIRGNRIERCNHGSIYLEIVRGVSLPSGHPSRYNKVVNNVIENHYGGGIFLVINPHHNLVEGNIIMHCGETTDFSKPGVQLSGSNNVLRKNIIYNPSNQALVMEAQSVIGYHNIADNNLIYNNTIFGSWYSFGMMVKNWSSESCSAERNTIANNIFYKSNGTILDSNGRQPEIVCNLYDANNLHNWCDPDQNGCLPTGTNWGWNRYYNNCIRRNNEGSNYNRLIIWARDASYGGGWNDYSLVLAESTSPVAWANNIGADPMITSESPDAFGMINGWWYLKEGSPCVDAGAPINDIIGAYVESLYPGYGWANMPYTGAAPDIGANEFNGESNPVFPAPRIRLSPNNR